jgi:hypothetical protein
LQASAGRSHRLRRPRSHLETHRRPGLGPQFLAKMRHYPFDRAKAHRDALLSGKPLADHIEIASMAAKALSNPRLQSVQCLRTHGWRWFAPSTFPQSPPRRRSGAPELHRTPAGSPTQRLQLRHGRKIIGSFISSHRKPSVCGSVSVVEMVIQTSPSDHERGWFLMSPAGRFVVLPDMEGASRGSAASDTKPADRHLITASRSGRPRPSRSSMRSRPGCTPNCPISWASRRWPPRSATR